jgi:hypothetical protein
MPIDQNTVNNVSSGGFNYGDPDSTGWENLVLEDPYEEVEQMPESPDGTTSVVPPGSIGRVWLSGAVYTFVGANEQGDGAAGLFTDHGSSVVITEKGVVGVKAGAPNGDDPSMGCLEFSSQHATKLSVGTNLSIQVNASGKHKEDGSFSSSQDQSITDKKFPAFSINVSKGGLDITCEDGNIALTGKNIILHAGENIQMTSQRSIQILAGYSPIRDAAGVIGDLFGFDLPAPGGGDVIIKAGKFTVDSTTDTSTASTKTEKAGGMKISETGSAMATVSERSAGDKIISTTGNVLIQAGQKMRFEAQGGEIVSTAGVGVPPAWAASQLEALNISVNKKPAIAKDTAFKVEVENGDYVTSVNTLGDYAVNTANGSIALLAGFKGGTVTTNPGDLLLRSDQGNAIVESKIGYSILQGKTQSGYLAGSIGSQSGSVAFIGGYGYDAEDTTPGVTLKSQTGITSVLGKVQVGMGIGQTPTASTNFIAVNPAGLIAQTTGPITVNGQGAITVGTAGVMVFKAISIFLN